MIIERPEDHCWLVAGAQDWRIVEMRGLSDVRVVNYRLDRATLDLSGMNWPAYCAKAVELMRWMYDL